MKGLLLRLRALLRRPLESFADAPDLFHAYRGWAAHPALERKPGGWVYKGRFYPDYLTTGGASHAIARVALPLCRGSGVDVGSGLWPLPGAIPVDAARGPGHQRSIRDFADASLDYVFSSHCLEHIGEWREELRVWIAKLKPGGVLFLYLPHPDCGLWEPGSPMVGDGHVWQPTFASIEQALHALGLAVIAADRGPDAMQSFHLCARKPAE
jgi:SAM-dependent methyltransferase